MHSSPLPYNIGRCYMKQPREDSYEILLIGNTNNNLSETVAHMIARNGYHVTTVWSAKAAKEELDKRDFDLVITYLNWLLIGGIIAGVIVVGLIIFLLARRSY